MRRNRIGERKTLTPSEKRIHYTPAPGETFSQLPIRTNFIPVLPSCEKWQLTARRAGGTVYFVREEIDALINRMIEEARKEVAW